MTASSPSEKHTTLKLIFGLAILAALIFIVKALPVEDWLQSFSQQVKSFGLFGYVIFAAIYTLATVLFLPGSILTLGAGVAFGLGGGIIAVSMGSTLGAACAFLIARYLVRDKVVSRWGRNEKFNAIDKAIGRQGSKIVLLLRLSPVFPFNALNYILGLTKVPFPNYIVASWVGMIPGTVLYVYLGTIGKAGIEAASGSTGKDPLEYVFLGVGLLITVIATLFITRVANKALKETGLEKKEASKSQI